MGLASGPASNATSFSAYTSGLSTAPIAPNIWEEPAVGVLRVTPINPAVLGCEVLEPASSDVEQRVGPGSGTGFPEPSVTKDEGPGPPDLDPCLDLGKTMRSKFHTKRR